MNEQKTNFKGIDVRFLVINGEIWFVANDVAIITGHVSIKSSIYKILDEDEVQTTKMRDTIGRLQEQIIISESGFYRLVFNSNLPDAKEFTKYVTSVVLPQIRKTGTFGNNQLSENINRLSEHMQNLKSLKIQSFELNKKIRNEKMKIEDIELIVFSNSKISKLKSSSQTDLFCIEA